MDSFWKSLARFIKVNRGILICIAGGIVFSLYLHLVAGRSMLQYNEATWLKSFELHSGMYPYSVRFFQTFSTILLTRVSGLPLKESFYVIQYLLLGIIAFLFYKFCSKLHFNKNWSVFGVALFLLSFPIAAAHFEPVQTWDDFWMYGFLILTFMALLNREWLLTSIYFTLGCFAREQMVLFYPILLIFCWSFRKEFKTSNMILVLLLPVVAYGLYYILTFEPSDPKRWSLITYNFANSARTADATISIWNCFGFVWIAAVIGSVRVWQQSSEKKMNLCLKGALISVTLTLLLGVFFTLVRETRILFPPFVFVLPLAVYTIRKDWTEFVQYHPKTHWLLFIVLSIIMIFLGLLLSPYLWLKFDYLSSIKLRQDFAGVNMGLGSVYLIILIANWLKKTKLPATRE